MRFAVANISLSHTGLSYFEHYFPSKLKQFQTGKRWFYAAFHKTASEIKGEFAVIEVSHLSKSYGSRPAVQDLSFTVPDGQIYGLLGPNGAGKSTIMNILTGYLAPTEGEVKVAGFRLPEQAQQAKACVGYLPEQPPLYPEMTVQEYLDFVAELKGVKHAQRKQQVLAAARRTGLEEVLPRVIRSLSKGYRQRVGIAQALLGSPQLIILDEPTVGLDPAQVIEIRKLIRELGKAQHGSSCPATSSARCRRYASRCSSSLKDVWWR